MSHVWEKSSWRLRWTEKKREENEYDQRRRLPALSFQDLFCSGSEDFDDEDFVSALEDAESSQVIREPTSVSLRPIPKNATEVSPPLNAPPSVQEVDDEELLSLCSEVEAEVSQHHRQVPNPHLLLRPLNQNNGKDPNSSSFQLRPPRSNHDAGARHCLSDITAQSQHPCFGANHNPSVHLSEHGPSPSPGPGAKRPCLRPGVEPQPVTPVRGGSFTPFSSSAYPRPIVSPSASGSAPIWQTGPSNSHPMPRTPLSSPRPHPPNTVVTNHLLQLMTAANKTPKNLPWETPPPKERRFPGPAGLLPQQGSGRKLDEILVSTPHTPSHGARAKPQSNEGGSAQQQAEDQFIRGPWATMKAELSLDENDPACFLRTYSVVMVLRKAALKQLPRNKVPRIAVALKTLTPANGDASAVFRDPTGDIQGTVHHLLLEERESELKIGSVLLLEQVGVFSPSHRNHYLNVTPSNLVKIYPPLEEGVKTKVPHEVDHNSNQTRSPLHPSSSRDQPCAAQRPPPPQSSMSHAGVSQSTESHPSSRSLHSARSLTSFNTTCSRNTQPAASRPSPSSEPPETPRADWELDDLDSLFCDLPED